jgi:hypothetical protein
MKNNHDFDQYIANRLPKAIESHYTPKDLSPKIVQTIQEQSSCPISMASLRYAAVFVLILVILGGFLYLFHAPSLSFEPLDTSALVAVNGKSYSTTEKMPLLSMSSKLESSKTQVSIDLGNETKIILDENTVIHYANTKTIKLDQGRLYYQHTGSSHSQWVVKASNLTFTPVGTEFDLSITPEGMQIHVLKGMVRIERAGDSSTTLPAGNTGIIQNQKFLIEPTRSDTPRWWPEPTVPWSELIR